MHAPLASDVASMCGRLKNGSRQQRSMTWQKLVSLGEDGQGLDGDKIARSGLVPILVAMLEQVPSRRDPEVQDQAASLLFEAAGSDAGMEVLVTIDCIPSLTAALQSGSYVKQTRVCAILGMISLCNQRLQVSDRTSQFHRNATMLSCSSIPEMTRVLASAGCSDAACAAMILKALAAMLYDASAGDQFVKAGGLEVLSLLLANLSRQSSTFLLSNGDCGSSCSVQCLDDTAVWLAAVTLIGRVAASSATGAQSILQGTLLYLLMQCCSSSSPELQLLALKAILDLSAVPSQWPKPVKAGQVLHLATALRSPQAPIQQLALSVITALMPILTEFDECLLMNAMECLMGSTEDSNSNNGETLESCEEDGEEEDDDDNDSDVDSITLHAA